jgi:glutamate-5-semialdehyde dehydrogenase
MSNATKDSSIDSVMTALGIAARVASTELATTDANARNKALRLAADAIRAEQASIIAANQVDMAAAQERQLSPAMLDRLALDEVRVEAMASGIETIEQLPDPVGRILAEWERPNGLNIQRVSVPLGVIGIIYESRPNVTADAAGLCLKSGNAVILRGGSESFNSSQAIYRCMESGLREAGLPVAAIQMIPTTDRAAVGYLLSSMSQYLDVVVPRGGKSLIARVQKEARVPVIGHLEGLCHVYLHESADTVMATEVTLNAKMRRTGICGAAETLLVDRSRAADLLPPVADALTAAGCEIRGDESVCALVATAIPVNESDWSTEYLDAIISVRVVDNIDEAIEHIRRYGSGHTESIIASDKVAAEKFLGELDSAILLHNASTQYADGGEFGMGAEIGIATDRIHARGPVGAEQLTSYKYIVRGDGQTRP